jgi:hypothetical protein
MSLDLPSRPAKASDSRAKSFPGAAVEAEAIPVDIMQEIVREAIEEFIDPGLLSVVDAAETSERELLYRWAEAVEGRL